MFTEQEFWLFVDDAVFMRHLVFWLVLLVGVPLGAFLSAMYRWFQGFIFMLMIWSTCEPEALGISFFHRELYRTAVRGFEVYLVDICALVLFGSILLRLKTYRPKLFVPLSIPYLLFFACGVLSWVVAADYLIVPAQRVLMTITATPPDYQYFETKLYPMFELFRLMRAFFVFWVTVNYVRSERELRQFYWAVAITISYLTAYALYQRYVGGIYRVSVGLGHPNDLAVFTGMLGAVLVPLIFQRKRLLTSLFFGLMVICVFACEILSVSRSGLFVFAVGTAVLGLYGLARHVNTRNLILVVLGVVAILAVFVRGRDTLIDRFIYQSDIVESLDERVFFNQVGIRMANDHPLGVGLGNFSAWSWEKYAELVWGDLEPGVPAHNIWYLTLGELGWIGVLLLALIWLRAYQIAWLSLWKDRGELAYSLLLGIIFATLMLHGQSLLHHSYRSSSIFYLTQILLGVMIGYFCRASATAPIRSMWSPSGSNLSSTRP